jgi:hypothetical protein
MNHDHPSHYNQGNIECIDAIASALSPQELDGFVRGNVMKYIWRSPHKNNIEDLKKAQWYLSWYISKLEEDDAVN